MGFKEDTKIGNKKSYTLKDQLSIYRLTSNHKEVEKERKKDFYEGVMRLSGKDSRLKITFKFSFSWKNSAIIKRKKELRV